MKRTIRKITKAGYNKVAKPLMFKHQPDAVHKNLVKTAKTTQKIPGVRSLPKLWQHSDKALEVEVAGVKFSNPVGLSAGFDKKIEMPLMMKNVGFGWMTGGSVTWGQYEGNEGEWFYRLPKSFSLVVNAGLPSEGAPVVAERIKLYREQIFQNFPLSISVAKTNSREAASDTVAVKDYCDSLEMFDKLVQVKFLEINISCPNTFGGEPFTTPDRLDKLLSAVDKLALKKPVFIKMPISLNIRDYEALLDVIVKHKIAGVAVGNLLKDRSKARLKDDLPSSVKGNLSGLPCRDISTELIRRTYQKYGDKLAIMGIGGIMSAEDAYAKIRAGASLVGLVTGLIYKGPQLVGEVNAGLAELLKSDGYQSIGEAVGSEFST